MPLDTTNKNSSFELKLLRTSCIALLGSQPALLATTLPLALHAPAATAETLSAEAVAKMAQSITVRIEGATQGSGTIIQEKDSVYTVLTAWHVVSSSKRGEVLLIYTSDGRPYAVDPKEISRMEGADLASFKFYGPAGLPTAKLRASPDVSSGETIYVSGYSLPTTTIPASIFRFANGMLVANVNTEVPDGYNLVYTSPTVPGMSGGGVFDTSGKLVGIHGREESSKLLTESGQITLGTRNKQGIPITTYSASISTQRKYLQFNKRQEFTEEKATDAAKPKALVMPENDMHIAPSKSAKPQANNERSSGAMDKPLDQTLKSEKDEETTLDKPEGNRFKEFIDDSNKDRPRNRRTGAFREP